MCIARINQSNQMKQRTRGLGSARWANVISKVSTERERQTFLLGDNWRGFHICTLLLEVYTQASSLARCEERTQGDKNEWLLLTRRGTKLHGGGGLPGAQKLQNDVVLVAPRVKESQVPAGGAAVQTAEHALHQPREDEVELLKRSPPQRKVFKAV